MSNSNSAAIRRRVHGPNANAQNPSKTPSLQKQNDQQGYTLQQIISNFDTRISLIEDNMNRPSDAAPGAVVSARESQPLENTDEIYSILEEYNARFEMVANEIAEMKDVLLKLQSFTMDVNKRLHEERIQILSELDQSIASNTIVNIDNNSELGMNLAASEHIDDTVAPIGDDTNKDAEPESSATDEVGLTTEESKE